jgi:predicted O-methyltransferase YrrM
VDAAKSQYRRYLEHFLKNSRTGTVFIFDNLNFHGIVENESLSHNRSTIQMMHKIKKFRDHLLKDERFTTEFHSDIGDGVAVSIRIK